jgi:HEPN domain-containing protein
MGQSPDRAAVLFRKGKEDAYALECLADNPRISDSVVGFHAQQAVEKFMKAVLARRAVEFPRTHNLALLLDMLSDNRVPLPPEGEGLVRLTPYGAHLRYDTPAAKPAVKRPLDRSWLRACVKQTQVWAEKLLSEQGGQTEEA